MASRLYRSPGRSLAEHARWNSTSVEMKYWYYKIVLDDDGEIAEGYYARHELATVLRVDRAFVRPASEVGRERGGEVVMMI